MILSGLALQRGSKSLSVLSPHLDSFTPAEGSWWRQGRKEKQQLTLYTDAAQRVEILKRFFHRCAQRKSVSFLLQWRSAALLEPFLPQSRSQLDKARVGDGVPSPLQSEVGPRRE